MISDLDSLCTPIQFTLNANRKYGPENRPNVSV